MVGIVIVSHSQKLAEGVRELSAMMAANAPVACAGGLEDGSLGTSFEKIEQAALSVASKDGIIMLMDMGSAIMTAEMVIEAHPELNITLADCPIAEGAVEAAVSSAGEMTKEEILASITAADAFKKL